MAAATLFIVILFVRVKSRRSRQTLLTAKEKQKKDSNTAVRYMSAGTFLAAAVWGSQWGGHVCIFLGVGKNSG